MSNRLPTSFFLAFVGATSLASAGVQDEETRAARRMQRPAPAAQALYGATVADRRPVIGVTVSDVDPALAAQLGLEPGRGVLVTSVAEGLPAAEAGVKAYDVIVAIDGEEALGRESLSSALRARDVGAHVELTVLRGGKKMRLTVGVTEGQAAASVGRWLADTGAGASADDVRRSLEELESRLVRTRDALKRQGDDGTAEREALLAERAALEERVERLRAESAHQEGARRLLAELYLSQGDLAREQELREAEGEGGRDARWRALVEELQARSATLERALEQNLTRLESTRSRLADDSAHLRAEWLERQKAVQALLAGPADAESLKRAQELLRAQQARATAAYEDALRRLSLPEVRLHGDTGLLIDTTSGRADAAPSLDARLRSLEERLSNIERLLGEQAERSKGSR